MSVVTGSLCTFAYSQTTETRQGWEYDWNVQVAGRELRSAVSVAWENLETSSLNVVCAHLPEPQEEVRGGFPDLLRLGLWC